MVLLKAIDNDDVDDYDLSDKWNDIEASKKTPCIILEKSLYSYASRPI